MTMLPQKPKPTKLETKPSMARPTDREFTKPEQSQPLGLVWIKCALPTLSLGLEKILKAYAAHVHQGQKPPASDPASLIILFCSSAEDVASEVEHLRALAPNAPRVVVFGLSVDLQLARSALKAGASGFIHAGMSPQQIVRALSVASEGEAVLPRELLNQLVKEQSQADLSVLTPRQLEILELVAEGESNAQMAHRLFLSENTIKQHLSRAYKTLGVKNRIQAARLFQQKQPRSATRRNMMQPRLTEAEFTSTERERRSKMSYVLLVEPHHVLRQALACSLDGEPDFEVSVQASSLAEVRTSTSLEEIDVAVAEILLPDGNGTDLIREIESHRIPVVVMTSSSSAAHVQAALEAGANEVLGKDASFEELVEAMRRGAGNGRARLPSPERRSGAP